MEHILQRCLLFLAFITLCSSLGLAQVEVSYIEIEIPTRDGKALAADLYATDTTVAKPVILIQTPYNKNFYRNRVGVPQAGGSPFPYDSLNYTYVVLDWRGRFGSSNADSTGYDRGLDGYDAVEWAAAQTWCNGKVGTWGPSALGVIQFQTARQRPPHLVCAVPIVADFKTEYTDYYYGGVFREEQVDALVTLGFTTKQIILSQPRYNNLWKIIEQGSAYADEIEVPMLMISGWFDHYPDAVMRAFQEIKDESAIDVRDQHKLIMGPWLHSNIGLEQQGELSYPAAVGVPDAEAMRFFNYYLRELDNGYASEPVVLYFQMGTDEWRNAEDWRSVQRRADTMYLHSDGVLNGDFPETGEASRSFSFDPHNPLPAIGGQRFAPFAFPPVPDGPRDQRDEVESRNDILIYSTPVLEQDLEIAGQIQVTLNVSSDREDTDFSIRLCDVYPDGRSMLVTDGIQRMRFRNSVSEEELMEPGTVYPVTVTLQNLAMTFKQGHRMRIIVTSSDAPRFDVNLNNGGEMYTEGDTLVAANTVYHDAVRPSMIILPTVHSTSDVRAFPGNNRNGGSVAVVPNPANATVTLTFATIKAGDVQVIITDAVGREVLVIDRPQMNSGEHNLALDLQELASGLYFYTVKTPDGILSGNVTVLR